MKIFKVHFAPLLGLGSLLIFSPIQSLAFCPLCVVATGTFTAFFRRLGVDDTIVGLWLGGFILSSSMVFNNFLARKRKGVKFQILSILAFYGISAFSLYQLGALNLYNKIFGIDKIFFGIIIGSLVLLAVPYLDRFLRKKNQGKIFISHQKVLLAVASLIAFSFIFYFTLP